MTLPTTANVTVATLTTTGTLASEGEVASSSLVFSFTTTAFSGGTQHINATAFGTPPSLALISGSTDTPAITRLDFGGVPPTGMMLFFVGLSGDMNFTMGGVQSGTAYPIDDTFEATVAVFYFNGALWSHILDLA